MSRPKRERPAKNRARMPRPRSAVFLSKLGRRQEEAATGDLQPEEWLHEGHDGGVGLPWWVRVTDGEWPE